MYKSIWNKVFNFFFSPWRWPEIQQAASNHRWIREPLNWSELKWVEEKINYEIAKHPFMEYSSQSYRPQTAGCVRTSKQTNFAFLSCNHQVSWAQITSRDAAICRLRFIDKSKSIRWLLAENTHVKQYHTHAYIYIFKIT